MSTDPLARQPSPVIRTQLVPAFVCGGPRSGFQMVEEPIHPPLIVAQGNAVRALRVARGFGLREGARLAGLSVVDLSAIELGRQHFSDWDAAFCQLAKLWGAT